MPVDAVGCFTTEGVTLALLQQLAGVEDALQLAQVCSAMNKAVQQCARYWYLQCCTVKNMRGQKVNHWTDYRRLYLTTRWQKQRVLLWSPKDQKHWSRLYRRKREFDRMEAALGERQEMELLREVVKQETAKLLTGKRPHFFQDLGSHLTRVQCDCKSRNHAGCQRHDKLCVRAWLHQHLSPWLEDSLALGTNKEHAKTLKVFEDKVRDVWKVCRRVHCKKGGRQIHFSLDRGTLVYGCDSGEVYYKKG